MEYIAKPCYKYNNITNKNTFGDADKKYAVECNMNARMRPQLNVIRNLRLNAVIYRDRTQMLIY